MGPYLQPTIPAGASLTPAHLLRFGHRLAECELFTDPSLERLLDNYPRDSLHITTMGERFEDGGWQTGRVGERSGKEILQAIRNGHLWLNVKHLHVHDRSLGRLLDDLYEELQQCWQARVPRWRAGTLLLSSPTAFVHYHADSVPNILWHIRGQKRVYVYPVDDPELAPPDALERICAGQQDEALPHRSSFDQKAQIVDLEPGQAVAWPQNSPHRVENLAGMNVSLSTEHLNSAARRLVNVRRANRLLRRPLSGRCCSVRVTGFGYHLKALLANSQRALHKLQGRAPISFPMEAHFHLDPQAPRGFAAQAQEITRPS